MYQVCALGVMNGPYLVVPQTKSFVSWHQDSTYWGLEPPDIVTAWVAFTPQIPLGRQPQKRLHAGRTRQPPPEIGVTTDSIKIPLLITTC